VRIVSRGTRARQETELDIALDVNSVTLSRIAVSPSSRGANDDLVARLGQLPICLAQFN
jgi:hypothetical protein